MNSASFRALAARSRPDSRCPAISPGSYLLAETDLSVMAAPYHRDNHGNRAALDILFAPSGRRPKNLRAKRGLATSSCAGPPGSEPPWQALAPEGLATQITQGAVPGWLRPVEIRGTPIHVYEIVGAGQN